MATSRKASSPVIFASALFLVVTGFYLLAAVKYPLSYIFATYEDLFGEWVQFWSIFIAGAVSARLIFVRSRYRWFFLLLTLSCFYVAMEEISWGQRIFEFSSPQFFRTNNLQGETNLHNFLTGPYTTVLKKTLSYGLAIGLTLFGLVYPLMLRLKFRIAVWFDRRGLAAPPLYLFPYFLMAAFLECAPFRMNEAEVAEVLVGLGLALMCVSYTISLTASNPNGQKSVNRANRNTRFFINRKALESRHALTAMAVFVCSALTTTALVASPSKRARIERRVHNGVEKFAGRYRRYERWDVSIDLYERLLDEDPNRVSILRKIAKCAQAAGDTQRGEDALQKALAIDKQALRENPKRASVNRSLARTYQAIGDFENAQKHVKKALRIDLERVRKNPHSAAAAYSLGKTYLLMKQYGPALEQLSKAFKMRPGSSKYRRSYYHAKKAVS